MKWSSFLAGAVLALLLPPSTADAFTFFSGFYCTDPLGFACVTEVLDVEETVARASRWDAAPANGIGLPGGLSVGVASGFEAALGAETEEEVAMMREGIVRGLDAWETAALFFDPAFDQASTAGFEIELRAVPGDDPAFAGTTLTGLAYVDTTFADLMLTNGQSTSGRRITHAEILINETVFSFLGNALVAVVDFADVVDLLEHFVMHEVGHAIGLGHGNEMLWANLDSDLDPLTPVAVDPLDPASGLMVSPNADIGAIMFGGFPLDDPDWFLRTELRPDDVAGRDVLYPSVPEACPVVLWALGLLTWWRRSSAQRARSGWCCVQADACSHDERASAEIDLRGPHFEGH